MYDLLVNLVKGSIPYTYIQVAHYTGKRVSEWLAYIPSLTLHNAHELFMKEEEKKKNLIFILLFFFSVSCHFNLPIQGSQKSEEKLKLSLKLCLGQIAKLENKILKFKLHIFHRSLSRELSLA